MSEFAVSVLALVVSVISVAIAVSSVVYTRRSANASVSSADAATRSADLAEVVERGRHHGWRIEARTNQSGQRFYTLRNVGTVDARDLILTGAYMDVNFHVKELTAKGIVIRSLREGIDSSTSAGRMVIGVLASLAELELELGRERRAAAREARRVRGLDTGRPKALTAEKRSQLARLAASGEPVSALAGTFGISTRTAYRIVREERDSSAA